jgi:uncharacterized protein YbjT (DUF2867 family)
MKKVLVLGAGGQIARWVIEMLENTHDIELKLFLRDIKKLKGDAPQNAKIVQGDVLNSAQLNATVAGQDIVYANLTRGMTTCRSWHRSSSRSYNACLFCSINI